MTISEYEFFQTMHTPPSHEPSPEEIARLAAEIRATWPDRRFGSTEPVEIHEVETSAEARAYNGRRLIQ